VLQVEETFTVWSYEGGAAESRNCNRWRDARLEDLQECIGTIGQ
jgi:hypothetical protein